MADSKKKIGIEIALDNEKAFKDAVANINNSLKVLSSEMKKTSTEFEDNASSADALRAKGDILNRTLLTQQEKLEEIQKALQNSADNFGEADNKTLAWQKSLNDVQTAILNTQKAIEENNEALETAGENSDELEDKVEEVSGSLGEDIPVSAGDALEAITGFSTKSILSVASIVTAIKKVIDVYKQLIQMTTDAAGNAQNILTIAEITGFDTDTVQEFQYAADYIGVSFDKIQDSVKNLVNNMESAKDGTGDAAEAFKELGISVRDENGDLRDSEEVFYDVIDALGNVSNDTEKSAYAMDIFGDSASDLMPLIEAGTDSLNEYAEEAQNVGAVLSGEDLEALEAVNTAYLKLQDTQDAIKNQISAEMAPTVEEFYTAWSTFCQQAGEALIESGLLDQLKEILQNITNIIEKVTLINAETIPDSEEKLSGLKTVINDVSLLLAAMRDTINAIKSLMQGNWISMLKDLGLGYSSGYLNNYQATLLKQQGATWQNEITGWRNTSNASGDQNFEGGLTWVGESGKELVSLPQGSRIYSAQESQQIASGDTYNITIDAKNVKEFNDIINMVKTQRVTARMRG